MSRLADLYTKAGQSVWLDFIRRDLLLDGELQDLVDEGIRGLTSNPTIFQKAIAGSELYDAQITELTGEAPEAVFEAVAVKDIRGAADLLRPVYDASEGTDGLVSLEVSPHLANDTEGTIEEAHRLWDLVDRPNLMIKVPATPAGVPALEELIASGVNVNATLMFSLGHYEAIALAYIRGVERAEHPERLASVASFFVSRVDTKADAAFEKHGSNEALGLRGTVAVANAKLAYRRFQEIFEGDAFEAARARGTHVQRPLWASTSTKNPEYRDVLYVDDLVGPHTVNTMPPVTIDAFRHHGTVDPSALTSGVDQARALVDRLPEFGIDYEGITEELQVEGVQAFADSFDELLSTIEEKQRELR